MQNLCAYFPTILIRDILTRQSFLNAIAVVNAIGGSTNAVCLQSSRENSVRH
jgi:dihydroxyacid dehydratase/phosphogluconate dehydratase